MRGNEQGVQEVAVGQSTAIDERKIEALLGKAVTDFGATISTSMAVVGDRLGLYKAVARYGPLDSKKLALITGTHERYVRDWLVNQAAGGYVTYDPEADQYSMTSEQRALMADENSPFYVAGGFQLFSALVKAEGRVLHNIRSGDGMYWTEHDPGLFEGTERFFRPGYEQNLVKSWIPALEGIEADLTAGVVKPYTGVIDFVDTCEDVIGTTANDILVGDAGANTLTGGDGDDTLDGRDGDDTLDGGAGTDTASFAGLKKAVVVDLRAGTAEGIGADTLIGIEDVEGSRKGDELSGDGAANLLDGGAGADLIVGRGKGDRLIGDDGNDDLSGGRGRDTLDGGAGRDILDGGKSRDTCIPGKDPDAWANCETVKL